MKKLYEWGMKTDLWLKLAMISAFAINAIVMLRRKGYNLEIVFKPMGLLAFVLLAMICIRYSLYKKAVTWLFAAFLVWCYIGNMTEHVGIVKTFGCVLLRLWYIALLMLAVTYVCDEKRRDRWINLVFIFYCAFTTFFFIASFVNVTLMELKPGYVGKDHLGTLISGRFSLFGNPNYAGPTAALLILFSVLLIYRFRRSSLRGLHFTLLSISCLTGVIAISLSRCRTAIIATAAGLGLCAFILIRDRFGSLVAGIAACIAVAAVSTGIMLAPKPLYDKALTAYAENHPEISNEKVESEIQVFDITYSMSNFTERTLIWSGAIRMMNDKPELWVYGLKPAMVQTNSIIGVYEDRPEIPMYTAHSGYLESLVDYGIPGAAILLVILVIWIVTALRCIFSKSTDVYYKMMMSVCLACAIHSLMESFLFPYNDRSPYVMFFFMVMGGAARVVENASQPAAQSNGSKTSRTVLRIAASAAGYAVLVAALTGFMYSRAVKANKLPDDGTHTEISDGTLLTPVRIKEYNIANKRMLYAMRNCFALEDVGEKFYYKSALDFIKNDLFKPEENKTYLLDKTAVSEEYFDKITLNANVESLTERINTRFGFMTSTADLKRMPVNDRITEEGGNGSDVLTITELAPFMPIVILHESADKEWFFVLAKSSSGWIRKTDAALCTSRAEWLDHMKPADLLVVTDEKLILPENPSSAGVSGLAVPMGTVLPVVSKSSDTDGADTGTEGYKCRAVSRASTGEAEYVLVTIASDMGVHHGYLDYTEDNVVSLMQKIADKSHTESGDDRPDRADDARKIYACFGYDLPCTAEGQARIVCSKKYAVSGKSTAGKKKILQTAPAGTLLIADGITQIYPGDTENFEIPEHLETIIIP